MKVSINSVTTIEGDFQSIFIDILNLRSSVNVKEIAKHWERIQKSVGQYLQNKELFLLLAGQQQNRITVDGKHFTASSQATNIPEESEQFIVFVYCQKMSFSVWRFHKQD